MTPLALAIRRAFWENPSWRGRYPSWIAVAVWAHEYADHKPTREEVAAALEELKPKRRSAA